MNNKYHKHILSYRCVKCCGVCKHHTFELQPEDTHAAILSICEKYECKVQSWGLCDSFEREELIEDDI